MESVKLLLTAGSIRRWLYSVLSEKSLRSDKNLEMRVKRDPSNDKRERFSKGVWLRAIPDGINKSRFCRKCIVCIPGNVMSPVVGNTQKSRSGGVIAATGLLRFPAAQL